MKKITLLFVIMYVIAGNQVFAQKNYLPGYVLLPGNDTLRGLVDYREWESNPSRIAFKPGNETTERNYTRSDIEGFAIDGIDRYKRAYVRMDMNPVTLQELSNNPRDSSVTDTVFLRVIVDGNELDLYEFVNFKPHFFIQDKDGDIEELGYRVSFDETKGTLVTHNNFREQLQRWMIGRSFSSSKINETGNVNYEMDDLVKFVSSLNGPSTVFVPRDAKKMKSVSNFFAGGGVVMGKMGFEGTNKQLNSLVFDNAVSFIISGGVDLYTSRNLQNLFLRGELSVSGFTGEGAGTSQTSVTTTNKEDNTYSFRQLNITPAVSINYVFVRGAQFKAYAGIGLGYNISSYPKHLLTSKDQQTGDVTTEEDFPKLQPWWPGLYGRLGFFIKNNLEFGITTQLAGSFIRYVNISETSQPVSLQLFYRFR